LALVESRESGEFGGLIGFPTTITVNDAAPGTTKPVLFDHELGGSPSLGLYRIEPGLQPAGAGPLFA
jgi:hypothetical protein